jgi:hypothetical protein
MPSEALQTASLKLVVRASRMGGRSRRVMIGAGLLAGGAIAVLAHRVGADPRGFTGGQPGFLAGLLIESSGAQVPEQPN